MRSSEGYITTDGGARLFYKTVGDGPVAVIIPNGIPLIDDFQRVADGRTLIFYDLRNRGLSDPVGDASKLEKGIHHDVEDLEAVRRHFCIRDVYLIGHSYVALTVALYAIGYPVTARRVVQIAPIPPDADRQYPPHLTGADATTAAVMSKIAQIQQEPAGDDPKQRCRKLWSVLRLLYVVSPADADRIRWARCELANERNFQAYWKAHLLPSIQRLKLDLAALGRVATPFLTIHGARDRNAPYGGAREWAKLLPNARLLTLDHAGHAPWVEAPGKVFASIDAFLHGSWPEGAEQIEQVDPYPTLLAPTQRLAQ